MTNEQNEKAQLMRDKARENAAFYYPPTVESLEHAMHTMAEAHHVAMETEHQKVLELEREIAIRENLKTSGRQLELDAMEKMLARNKELEQQLAQAQDMKHCQCFKCRDGSTALYCLNCAREGWLSPDEAKLERYEKALRVFANEIRLSPEWHQLAQEALKGVTPQT